VTKSPSLYLGAACGLDGSASAHVHLQAHHLVTHGVVLGMTGSGKTGLVTVLIEEALRAGVPALVIDVKGDLPNLLLSFPNFDPSAIEPWVEPAPNDPRSAADVAAELSAQRAHGLSQWDIGQAELAHYGERSALRVITPGSSAGELLHVLSSLERRSERWDVDPESARSALSAAVSLLLRLLGRDPDPAKSKEHVLLSVFAEQRLTRGESAELAALLEDLHKPPLSHIGALEIDDFLPRSERRALAAALNTLLASPTFASWRQGTTLDVGAWLTPQGGRTPGVIVSVAHLDDDERALVLGVLLEEVLSWVRALPGSQRLRALIVFDEVYGFLPPHPQTPPTKRPLVALRTPARAFGVGVVVATQNPMDIDYRALSNAGLWCVGRLQTDADRARVVEGLAGAGAQGGYSAAELTGVLKQLAPRWFLMRNAHGEGTRLLQPRWAMSFMRGPMTRMEIRKALALRRDGKRAPDAAAERPLLTAHRGQK
jgi:DNA helicase HerA-like ATPase